MTCSTAPLRFTVRRKAAELLVPAGPTPRGLNRLSDIDDQDCMRMHIPTIHFYRQDASISVRDPAVVIRDAVAMALVHYYPLAGRLRELQGRKLVVDCTGEGVLFIEADADVRLEHFGNALVPPFPGVEELLFDVPGSSQVLGTPLLLIQVTRLLCGGFVLAVRLMHTMADAQGLVQFLDAVAELARGVVAPPSVRPVWGRELLEARNPPRRPGFAHREYEQVLVRRGTFMPVDDMRHRPFFFGAKEVASMRSHLTEGLRESATTFEVLIGCIWKCRTVALAPDADEEMRMYFAVNARVRKGKQSAIPRGYYGNAIAVPVAVSAAGKLCAMPLGYAVQLVNEAKEEVDMDYMWSVADLMVQRGRRPRPTMMGAYLVSDVTKAGFDHLDFGWGRPVYGGPANVYGLSSFLLPFKNANGQDSIVIPMCLPGSAMDKFVQEMGKLLRPAVVVDAMIKSAL